MTKKLALMAFTFYTLTGVSRVEALPTHAQINDSIPPVNTTKLGPNQPITIPLAPPDWDDSIPTPVSEPAAAEIELPLPPAPEIYPTDRMLYNLRMCESTDNYRINTGNSFHGAYQYLQGTWNAVVQLMGLDYLIGVPVEQVAPEDQDNVTRWWWNHSNPHGQWPVCSWRV